MKNNIKKIIEDLKGLESEYNNVEILLAFFLYQRYGELPNDFLEEDLQDLINLFNDSETIFDKNITDFCEEYFEV